MESSTQVWEDDGGFVPPKTVVEGDQKFDIRLSVRTEWGPKDLRTYELGEVTIDQLAIKLKEFTDEETLLVNVALWNEEKLKRLREK